MYLINKSFNSNSFKPISKQIGKVLVRFVGRLQCMFSAWNLQLIYCVPQKNEKYIENQILKKTGNKHLKYVKMKS